MNKSSIEIYHSPEGNVELNVKLENDTVWLTQSQMAILFDRNQSVIARHISNIYKEGELDKESTYAKIAYIPETRERVYETALYNLDVIISVGYRVKSVNGTRFRQWANKVLKEYLIKGYAINKEINAERYNELKDVVRLMARTISLQSTITNDEYSGLFNVIGDYVYALDILDRYDYQNLSIIQTTKDEQFRATYENAIKAINALKGKFRESRWFANEKDS